MKSWEARARLFLRLAHVSRTLGLMPTPLLLERSGSVATLTLNRPEALNTLDFTLMDALVDATAEVAADDTLRVVVVRGAGKHFMAGGDLRTFDGELAKPPAQRNEDFRRMIGRLHSGDRGAASHAAPGGRRACRARSRDSGLSLMNACDLVVAADDTYFASAYRNIALTPDGGGSWSLPRLVGTRRAMEILLLGERFDARQALEMGLVNRVVPAGGTRRCHRRDRAIAGAGSGARHPQREAPGPRIARHGRCPRNSTPKR